jgi:hypothetical protein
MSDTQPLPQNLVTKAAQELESLIEKVVTLQVTTVIATARVDAGTAFNRGAETVVSFDAGTPQLVGSTTINMALGDYTQVLDPAFVNKPEYAKLHEDALTTARAIRSETVSLLTTLAKAVESHL